MRKWDGKQYQDKGKEPVPVWTGDRAVFILQSSNPTTVWLISSTQFPVGLQQVAKPNHNSTQT